MCGILGSVNLRLSNKQLDLLDHRGPEYKRLDHITENNIDLFLGHTRLAIIDVSSAGNQPMVNPSNNDVIVFNGELYNHSELRNEINFKKFRSHSDTETLLHFLGQNSEAKLHKLNGIFSFCHYSRDKNELLLARDPFGVKPLYYFWDGVRFVFSSELKVIVDAVPNLEVSEKHMFSFLKLRYNPSPETLYKNVYKLRPGHFIKFDLSNSTLSEQKLYSYIPKKVEYSEEDALEIYDTKLRAAIKRQLLSDVPIAFMLSGGVDSALVAHLAQEITGEKYAAYTAGYKEITDIDEMSDGKRSADLLGMSHRPVLIDNTDFIQNLSDFVKIIEEPLGSQSITPMFHLSQAIHQDEYKVVMSGQGVDEVWAGYKKYNYQDLMEKFPHLPYNKLPFINSILRGDQKRRALNTVSSRTRLRRFIETCSIMDNSLLKRLLKKEYLFEHEKEIENLFSYTMDTYELNGMDASDALMSFDTRMNLSDDLLLYTDKISMKHSLEVRVPFLDIELVKAAEQFNHKHKMSRVDNKILHKKLAERYLPKEIIYRKKQGFSTPRKKWFKEEIGNELESMMINSKGMFNDLFDKKEVSKLFYLHRSSKENYEKQIYQLVCLYFWLQHFHDDKSWMTA